MPDNKFPSEVIDLPSEGRLYSEGHPLKDGKIEIKYMTAREEDILTSQNLIKKGLVVDKLLDSLILTEGVKSDDLILGDKNAVMVAARNLAECPFKKLPKDVKENLFEVTLPISKRKIKFSLLTGKDERLIDEELNASKKVGAVSPELTTRLRYLIKEVDGDNSQSVINEISQNILSRDSMYLREEIKKVTPDIIMEQEIDLGGEAVKVDIPMTVGFFWPNSWG